MTAAPAPSDPPPQDDQEPVSAPGLLLARPLQMLFVVNAAEIRETVHAAVSATDQSPDVVLLDLGLTPDLDSFWTKSHTASAKNSATSEPPRQLPTSRSLPGCPIRCPGRNVQAHRTDPVRRSRYRSSVRRRWMRYHRAHRHRRHR